LLRGLEPPAGLGAEPHFKQKESSTGAILQVPSAAPLEIESLG